MTQISIQPFFDPATCTVTYVDWLLETHAHADHLSAAPYLKRQLGGDIGIGMHICTVQAAFKKVFNAKDMNTEGTKFDRLFEDEERFKIGNLTVRVLHTPATRFTNPFRKCWPCRLRRACTCATTTHQRAGNIHVHDGVTEAEFVALRTARDKTLAMPVLILPAVQINVRTGHLPPAEDNGVSYLKIPINLLPL